ncbi:MAG: hypothetical protein QM820_15450 [Minicystis sp.]
MSQPVNPIDREIVDLNGGIFSNLPQQVMPLEAFRLETGEQAASNARAGALALVPDVDDFVRTQEMRRVQLDSFAPMAMPGPSAPTMPEKRSASRAFGAALAVGVGCLVAAGLLVPAKQSAPASQAAMVQAPAPVEQAAKVEQAPAKAEAPAPVAAPIKQCDAAPAKSEPAKVEPQKAESAKVDAMKVDAAKAAPVKATVAASVPVKAAPAAEPTPAAAPVSTADLPMDMPVIPPAPKAAEVPFSASSAAVAIANAGMRAQSCKDGDASMSVPVSVTFASSGRAVRATINGGPFAGTPAGSCLAQALRNATVPSFDGEPVTVNTTVHLR